MNFFGVGLPEIILILILGLLVVGPERLIGFARFLGQGIARLMAWQHQSPEAQLIAQIRRDIEGEIHGIRDELIQAKQQLDSDMRSLQQELPTLQKDVADALEPLNMGKGKGFAQGTGKPVPTTGREALPRNGNTPLPDNPPAGARADETSEQFLERLLEHPPMPSVGAAEAAPHQGPPEVHSERAEPDDRAPLPEQPESSSAPSPSLLAQEYALLSLQSQALMSDFHALLAHLQEQGYIDADWKPPSHTMQQEAHRPEPEPETTVS